MPSILLVNDDGPNFPSLLATYEALDALDGVDVTVVVPAEEQSWIGKAVSRRRAVEVTTDRRHGFPLHLVDGYPADCVQIGAFHLLDHPPDLIVSGINIGPNHSAAFLYGSGTVGATIEAALAGFRGIALSASSGPLDFPQWNARMRAPGSERDWQRLGQVGAAMVSRLLAEGYPTDADVLSVNLPPDATTDTPVVWTPLGNTRYGPLFGPTEQGRFEFDWAGSMQSPDGGTLGHTDHEPDSDIATLFDGKVTVAALRLDRLAARPEDLSPATRRLFAPPG